MEQGFVDIIQKLVKEQGKTTLFMDTQKVRAILSDYTRNEYKKETNLLKQMIEADCAKIINNVDNVAKVKTMLVKRLEDELGLSPKVTAEYLDLLEMVIRGDTSVTVAIDNNKSYFQNLSSLENDLEKSGIKEVPKPDVLDKSNSSDGIIRYDGVYYHKESGCSNYFRFYDDGIVINACSTGTIYEIKKWFNKEHLNSGRGKYKIIGNKVSFQSKSKEGTIDYNGIILPNKLVMDTHSNINGYNSKNEEYVFGVW